MGRGGDMYEKKNGLRNSLIWGGGLCLVRLSWGFGMRDEGVKSS